MLERDYSNPWDTFTKNTLRFVTNPQRIIPYQKQQGYDQLAKSTSELFRSPFSWKMNISDHLDEIITQLDRGTWDSWRRLWLDTNDFGLKHAAIKVSPFEDYNITNPCLPGGEDYIVDRQAFC